MADERVQRRLSAIAVADVVGYSRLMEGDETGTLAALKDRRKTILEPVVRGHEGRIIKIMGDGVLIEFASAVNAVMAALELQEKMAEANTRLSEDRRILLRIGINLGDIIGEGTDVYGEGVNIAARLEALATPGGICVSAKVRDETHGRLAVAFEDLGEQRLKNMSVPVRVFRVGDENALPANSAMPASSGTPRTRPSVAILPFANMSADPGEQYLSDGLTEDIITELSRFRQLQVVSRNHSFRYRGSDIDVVRAGRELGAQFLVEGSVRKAGDNIRIAAQLIDAASGHHVWAERFDCEKKEVFAVQDQVVRTIAATVLGQVKAAATEMALRKPPANLEAYECVLKADDLPFDDPESAAEAQKLFERAIKLDPTYARAYALFANLYVVRWSRDGSGSDDLLNTALRLARKSVELDGRDSACHQALGWIYMLRRSFDLAEHHKQRAVELAPNQPTPFTSLGWFYHIIGKRKQAFDIYTEARKIDPYFEPLWYWPSIGCFYFNDHEYEQALAHLGRTTLMVYWVEAYRAAAYAYLGNLEQARACSAEVQRLVPDFSSATFAAKEGFKNEEDEGHLRDGLLKAGLPS